VASVVLVCTSLHFLSVLNTGEGGVTAGARATGPHTLYNAAKWRHDSRWGPCCEETRDLTEAERIDMRRCCLAGSKGRGGAGSSSGKGPSAADIDKVQLDPEAEAQFAGLPPWLRDLKIRKFKERLLKEEENAIKTKEQESLKSSRNLSDQVGLQPRTPPVRRLGDAPPRSSPTTLIKPAVPPCT
jgi:hypothetical protein